MIIILFKIALIEEAFLQEWSLCWRHQSDEKFTGKGSFE